MPFESFRAWIPRSHGLPPQTAKRLDEVIAAERVRVFGPDEAPNSEPWQALDSDTDEWPFAWIAIELGARSFVHSEYRRISDTVNVYSDPHRDLRNVVTVACYVCAANGAQQLIPEIYRSALERLNDVHRTFPKHQMLGYGERVQTAAYDRMDEVLLLQIKGDIGLGWHSNSGCALQFWIPPEQLAQRAFQTVELTLECD